MQCQARCYSCFGWLFCHPPNISSRWQGSIFDFCQKRKMPHHGKHQKGEKVGINEKHECPRRNCEGQSFQKVLMCLSLGWGAKNSRPPPKHNSPAKASEPFGKLALFSLSFISFFFICDVLVNLSSPELTLHFWIVRGERPGNVLTAVQRNLKRQVSADVDEAQSHCGMSGHEKFAKSPLPASNASFCCRCRRFDGVNDWSLKEQVQGNKYNPRHSTNCNIVKARSLNKHLYILTFCARLLSFFSRSPSAVSLQMAF